MAVSRSEGYRLGAGKEAGALEVLADFLTRHLGAPASPITDADENFRLGDFRLSDGITIECKGQPIDPGGRYTHNFVEVFEDTSSSKKPQHEGGFRVVADLLKLTPDQLADAPVRRNSVKASPTGRVGHLPFVSASIHTFANAAAVAYVNREKELVAVYASGQLLSAVREAVLSRGFSLGAGRANNATYAVQVPYPPLIWRRVEATFVFKGAGDPAIAEKTIRELLALPHT